MGTRNWWGSTSIMAPTTAVREPTAHRRLSMNSRRLKVISVWVVAWLVPRVRAGYD